jgi:hypothetical protein
VLSVKVLAGLPPIRQRLSFLNDRYLVSALVKPNDLQFWNNSNCLLEWHIVRESKMVSSTHFLTEFDLYLVDFKFVPRVHNGVRMGLKGETPCTETPGWGTRGASGTTIYTDGSKTEGLVGIGIFLDDRDSYRFRLPGHCSIFTAEMCTIHLACDLIESKPMGAYNCNILWTCSRH